MQPLTLIIEGVLALVAIGLAVGAPLVGMRLQRRDGARAAAPALAVARPPERDELPVAA